jgi:hypothetical protein
MEDGTTASKMVRREEYGTECNKRRGRDKGPQTHAKPPPTAPGDLGSGDQDATPPRGGGRGSRIVAGTSWGRGRGQLKIQLIIQRVQDARGGECTVRWDSGAQISLVTHQYAEKAGFGRQPASIRITGVGAGGGDESNVQYKALLRRIDGSIAEIKPYGVDKITGNASSLSLSKAKALFPSVAGELESPAGLIQPLIGMDHMEEAPREEGLAQGVAQYCSRFGTGYVAGGDMSYPPNPQHRADPSVKVLSCRAGLFNPPEFLPAEAMGTEVPRRCPACKNCKECQFRMDSLVPDHDGGRPEEVNSCVLNSYMVYL